MNVNDFAEFNKRVECYSRTDLDPTFVPNNPIYDASFEERLNDVIRACENAKEVIRLGMTRQVYGKGERPSDFHPGEFAIGNWIVRPRFK